MKKLFALLVLLVLGISYAQDCDAGFRSFEHAAGTDCIPENPQRIVALQDQNVLLPLMELGVTPLGASGATNADGEGIFRRLDGYDTSDVVFLGNHREEDIELVASLEPDLIITTPSPDWHYETFSLIAPTIVIDMFNQPVQVALFQFADAVNRTAEAEALEARFNARVSELLEPLGSIPEETTGFVVLNNGAFRALPWVQGFGAAFEAIGFSRSAWEEENVTGIGVVEFSLEALGNVETDVIFLIDFTGDDGPDGQYEQFIANELVQLTPVGQANQIYQIDGTSMGGTSWLRSLDGVEQIAELLSDPNLDTSLVDEN
ncbi:MAG: ABC transporter substrate-binding protein [Deinococcota bacterium]